MVRRHSPKTSHVMVVADNPQTVDVLYSYFTRVGVASNGGRDLDAVSTVPPTATALVLFPDGFGRTDVELKVLALRRARPKLLIVLVTAAPQHFSAASAPDGRSLPPVILPKPAFGWTILDAIRSRANALPR